MKPITKLADTTLADGSQLGIWQRDGYHFLLKDGMQIASDFSFGSDQSMGEYAAAPVKRANQPTFLIDGLNLGHTLFSIMSLINKERAHFVVAEPCAPLVSWHEQFLPDQSGQYLQDPRVQIEYAPGITVARKNSNTFHGILIKHTHDRYNLSIGEASDFASSLKGGGLLIISIARPDTKLTKTLQRAGFDVSTEAVPAAQKGKQNHFHTLVLARKGRFTPFAQRRA